MNLKSVNNSRQIEPSYEDLQLPDPFGEEDTNPFEREAANAPTIEHSRPRSSTSAAVLKALPVGLSFLTLLYLFYLGGQVASIRQDDQVLVQTVNGKSIVAEPVDSNVRTPATVTKTIKQWADLSFNWGQKLPNGEQDPGYKTQGKTFPTRVIEGSMLMTYEVQQIWYQMFQERDDYLPPSFLHSDATRVFFPTLQTKPRLAQDLRTGQPLPDRIEVEVHGDWVEYSSRTPEGKLVDRLSFLLSLRPVVKTEDPLAADADSLQQAAYELRANGLEIYDIQRIKRVY